VKVSGTGLYRAGTGVLFYRLWWVWRGGGGGWGGGTSVGKEQNTATTDRTEVPTWDLAQRLAFLLLKRNNRVIRLQSAGCGNIAVLFLAECLQQAATWQQPGTL